MRDEGFGGEMAIRSYKDLVVWRKAMDLARAAYELVARLPSHEQFGLCSQIRRAAASLPANIAEGHARDSTKEFLHHLSFARGSLAELETFLTLTVELGYRNADQIDPLLERCDEIGRMLRGLQKRLKENSDGKS